MAIAPRSAGGRRARSAPTASARVGRLALAAGHAALLCGDWLRARGSFEEALRLEETAAALEGMGMAAWWLDDEATVFESRERAYRVYRRTGDTRGAGRVESDASFELARCRVELGRALLALGERAPAETELRAAQTELESLGSAHAAAVAIIACEAAASVAPRELPAGRLTRRELEVLRLVAKGLTNSSIARRPTSPEAAGPGGATAQIVARLDGAVDLVVSRHAHAFSNAYLPNAEGRDVLVTQASTQAFSSGTAYADIELALDPHSGNVVESSAAVITTWADEGPGL